jgi:hypothetical protein
MGAIGKQSEKKGTLYKEGLHRVGARRWKFIYMRLVPTRCKFGSILHSSYFLKTSFPQDFCFFPGNHSEIHADRNGSLHKSWIYKMIHFYLAAVIVREVSSQNESLQRQI